MSDGARNARLIDHHIREIGVGCCAPIFWFRRETKEILANGTITFAQTSSRLIAITAAHVVRGYEKHKIDNDLVLQIGDLVVEDLAGYQVAISDDWDIATFDSRLLGKGIGREISPLRFRTGSNFEDDEPITLFGYPGGRRFVEGAADVIFGPFFGLGGVHSCNEREIRYLMEREYLVPHHFIPQMPKNYDLGGISGGPVIGCFNPDTIINFAICAIISEASASLEYVVARRIDVIQDDGNL